MAAELPRRMSRLPDAVLQARAVERFQSLQRDFERMADEEPSAVRAMRELDASNTAGVLLVDAVRREWLPDIPGLSKLVARLDERVPPRATRKAVLTRCPANLFTEFAGMHKVDALNRRVVSDRKGGILPSLEPTAEGTLLRAGLNARRADDAAAFVRADQARYLRHLAGACSVLAKLLAERKGGQGSGRPPKCDKSTDSSLRGEWLQYKSAQRSKGARPLLGGFARLKKMKLAAVKKALDRARKVGA